MKKTIAILMCMVALCGNAQQGYPEELFKYELDTLVTYKGKAPKIGDFVTAFLSIEETSEIQGFLMDCWEHYLRHEPQDPCCQFLIDEKNGYLRASYDSQLCEDSIDGREEFFYEICYWNCADGKHKVIAHNFVCKSDGKYFLGQYDGIWFYIYDNDSHKLYWAISEDLGAEVLPVIDESNFETGEQMTESDDIPIVVHKLPQQGKDIDVVIYSGTRKTVTRLVWDGMRFNRE